MQTLDATTKFAHLGKPGSAFSKGFARRLAMVQRLVELKGRRILDMGCGEGVWLSRFAEFTDASNVYGSDIDPESLAKVAAGIPRSNLRVCPAEKLDFPDNYFDVVFSNEVLEHVKDDKLAVAEAIRVLKPGGRFIIFTPNRGWPFEQHGMFFRGKYYWGNIPFLPWMPLFVRSRLAPHVRNYWGHDIKKLFAGEPAKIVYHKHIFPGFDGLSRRFGALGRLARKIFHSLENTPLHFFGISHFVIVQKAGSPA